MKVVGIRFKPAGRVYSFDPGDVECSPGDWLVVETERGMALGQVAVPPQEAGQPLAHPLKQVLRKAEDRDVLRYEQNCEMEGYAYQFCQECIREKRLPMKLVDVEYLFDGSKVIFYFTSEGRVDFRDLVRDLARQFHTRIEMRQIGVRDESKMVGGVGCCGRELCCATWLTDFAPISVRMAKDQNVSLNPAKISGICGRLMCCLAYEHTMYREMARDLPKVGKRVVIPQGEGKVVRRNVLDGTYVVHVGDREVVVNARQPQVERPVVPAPAPGEEPRHAAPAERPRGGRAPTPPGQEAAEGATPERGGEAAGDGRRGAPQGSRKRRRRRRKRASQTSA